MRSAIRHAAYDMLEWWKHKADARGSQASCWWSPRQAGATSFRRDGHEASTSRPVGNRLQLEYIDAGRREGRK
eukprot:1062475-Prorocentrum_minimum.AAC.1